MTSKEMTIKNIMENLEVLKDTSQEHELLENSLTEGIQMKQNLKQSKE